MTELLTMAYRTLGRSKRRTFITAATVGLGVLLSVTFTATGDYGYTNMIDTSARMGYGHVTVEPHDYYDHPSIALRMKGVTAMRKQLVSEKGVTEAATRIIGQAMFATASKSVGGVFIGVDPAQETTANIFIGSLIKGSMFSSTDGKGVIIGMKMAQKLRLSLGKKLVWTTAGVNGEIVSEIARVSGIFQTGVGEVDGSFALFPLDRVRKTIGYGPDEATLISLLLADQRDTTAVRNRVERQHGQSDRAVLTWKKTQADLASLITIDKTGNRLFQFLIGLLISAGIVNTLMMSVLERKHEFGVLLAIGMSPGRLFFMVVAESFMIGLLGLLVGVVVTIPWYYFMTTTGIDLSSYIEEGYDVGGVLVDPVLKFRLYGTSVVGILTGVFCLTLLSGLYPAAKAGRTPPVESLRSL